MKILIQLLKITILVCVFSLIFHFSYALVSTKSSEMIPSELIEVESFSNSWNTNSEKFARQDVPFLWNIGVALSTNIGIKHSSNQINTQTQWKLGNPNAVEYISSDESITKHMGVIKEYYNLMKTDIKSYLDNSNSKQTALNLYIKQLENRYRTSLANISSLQQQKQNYSQKLKASDTRVRLVKRKIDKDFKDFNQSETENNITIYLKAKWDYNHAKIHIVFINQYIKQYNYLNNYNKKVLDALINNKDAIVKNSYVVVPDTGLEILKQMDLVMSEKDYKAANNE